MESLLTPARNDKTGNRQFSERGPLDLAGFPKQEDRFPRLSLWPLLLVDSCHGAVHLRRYMPSGRTLNVLWLSFLPDLDLQQPYKFPTSPIILIISTFGSSVGSRFHVSIFSPTSHISQHDLSHLYLLIKTR